MLDFKLLIPFIIDSHFVATTEDGAAELTSWRETLASFVKGEDSLSCTKSLLDPSSFGFVFKAEYFLPPILLLVSLWFSSFFVSTMALVLSSPEVLSSRAACESIIKLDLRLFLQIYDKIVVVFFSYY